MPVFDNISVEKKDASLRMQRSKRNGIVNNRLNKLLSVILPVLAALLLGFLMAHEQLVGLGIVGLLVGVATLLICILNAEAGLYIVLIYSFFISFFNRLLFDDLLAVGVLSDILIGATFFGFIIRRENIKTSAGELSKTRIGTILLIVYLYTLFEIFNPAGPSINGAVPVIRKIAGILLLLFISYRVFESETKINRFIKVLFFCCILVAVYACIQEWHGFFDFEMDWLRADPRRFRMTFVNGGARRMSFFPDAVSLAIMMSAGSVFFTGVAIIQKNIAKRMFILSGVVVMLLAMGYSLTRTSNVMLAAGLVMFVLITINQKVTRFFAFTALIIFLVLAFFPINGFDQAAQFIETLRGGTKDPSYLVREMNRQSIQPYIYTHPFGGGLSTTGEEGLTYHPGHRLAGFPPDGGYLKKALELGWVGFGLILFLYFTVIRTGIQGYFSDIDLKKKMLFASCTAALFCFYTGDFTQVAIGQITDVVVYYPLIAIILRLSKINQVSQTQ